MDNSQDAGIVGEVQEGDAVAFMSRHFVALTCHYNLTHSDGTVSREVFALSGWLLEVHNVYFWVTAGHCLKELDRLLEFKEVEVVGGGFMDSFGYGAVYPGSIPYRYEPGDGYYVTRPEYGIDFGLIALNQLQVLGFASNNLIPIGRENWLHQKDLKFEFYLMLGIPMDRVIKKTNPDGTISAHLSPSMVRVNKIGLDDLGETPSNADAPPSDAWFIGQIHPECTIRVVEGMSGGPIYGFRRGENGRLSYHVVALQSRWRDQSRTVFGCSVPLFAEEVHQQLGALIDGSAHGKERP